MAIKKIKKIMLVDDDKVIHALLSRLLIQKNFECVSAYSAKEAMEILDDNPPDIILSDYMMPEMDGFAFRKELMEKPNLRDIPFVFLTSVSDNISAAKGLELLALDYIDKNTPMPLVVSKLDNIIESIQKKHEQALFEIGAAAKALNLRSVPDHAPVNDFFKFDFIYETFENYPGGDFIDYISTENGQIFIIMGDVMGKKWGAWFFSFNFLSYIRSAIRLCIYDGELSTETIVQKINSVLLKDPMLKDILCTLSVLLLDEQSGRLLYTGAGDLPLLLYREETRTVEKITSSGLLLRMLPDGFYDQTELWLNRGDKILAFTDGMTDSNVKGIAKTNYNQFVEWVSPCLQTSDTFNELKRLLVTEETALSSIDDRSLIYIERL